MSRGSGKKVGIGVGAVLAGPFAVIAIFVLIVVILFAAASAPLGWLFGGGEPGGVPSANQPPAHAPNNWTPTPIPDDCYVTPTPVAITVAPNTPDAGQTPANTPAPGTPGGGGVTYLPTPTPCNLSFIPTPDPNFPPVGVAGGGTFDVRQGKINLTQVQQILARYPLYPLGGNGLPIPGSSPYGPNPLTPVAQKVLDFQDEYGINGGYALAQFVLESGMCTTGISPSAIECGNIVWTSGGNCATHNPTPAHDFCGYANWSDAIEAWFRLIKGYYIANGLTTVEAIIRVYAPCSDNGGCSFTDGYIANVEKLVTQWGVGQEDPTSTNNNVPHGSPFKTGPAGYWVTQAYGCTEFPEFRDQSCASSTGGRAPYFHRGVDIVSKGDPTVFATMSGTVIFAGFTGDGFGNRVYLQQGAYLVIYPHLSRIFAHVGQSINWGDPLGVQGSTGYSTGDHVHYEIHVNGAWTDSTPFLQKP